MPEYDEVLARLRHQGVPKRESMRIMREATGLEFGEVQRLVHESPVWSDRKAGDEAAQEWFFRSMFVLAVLGEADVTAPAEDVAECHDRRQRASTQLQHASSGLPDEALDRYRELMADGLLGRAFAELVAVARPLGVEDRCWQDLGAAADTLLLNEDAGDEAPPSDTEDFVLAAYDVRTRLYLSRLQNGDTGPTPPPSG
ncbi:hypothetical protein [Lentzea albidocapillata]|uniref:Uncharacterized protein n=1 Tax=Lentzea albidocapillata TaxID=40571 RepID=A0A1W2FL28_9PSEU|nr:hypothetical protein [Lentzea albidocapillata]SMD22677.1 hypothetical protein SAMN05660733_06919 [Lentzea albidocapillata]